MVFVHSRVIAQTTLEWATAIIVLCPIADVVVNLAISALESEFSFYDAVGRQEYLPKLRINIEEIGGVVEIAMTGFEHGSSSGGQWHLVWDL
jgi:hypothetical protein